MGRTEAHWSLQVQQCSKILLWLLGQEAMLTNYARWHRGLSANSNFSHCVEEKKDILYMIRDCSDSKEIWDRFDLSSKPNNFFSLTL